MMTTVSVRWQTVIPLEVRRELGIEPSGKLEWELKDGHAEVRPIPADPVTASVGLLRGSELTTETLLAERRRDRESEQSEP